MLDEDHYDLEKVKERILEHLAVSKLKNDLSGPILCFAGPPGVGKTSLGQSIARALGRKFARLSVGGVRDEAEIRGHRRTYIGAMPGTIIRHLRDAESMNPVVLIDEIDKMGADYRGDPASAMLEVLDPEQNTNFRDHYLDLPFDLSKTLFICTANTLDTIPSPLLDRMDVISAVGIHRGREVRHREALPRPEAARGARTRRASRVAISDQRAATDHPRVHARGRRAQSRAPARRRAAQGSTQIAEGKTRAKTLRIDERRVRNWLGPRRFEGEVRKRTSDPGVATGLAFTRCRRRRAVLRGDRVSGQGQADHHGPARRRDAGVGAGRALVGARARRAARPRSGLVPRARRPSPRAGRRGPEGRALRRDHDGDGDRVTRPQQPVSEDVGMTGEITLTGQVLPIGGIREKSLAAQRAGLKRVIMPRENEPDLAELPAETKRSSSSSSSTRSRRSSRPRSTARRGAIEADARTERGSQADSERREQPVAGFRVAAALVAAEQVVLGLSAQHEPSPSTSFLPSCSYSTS